MTNLELYDKVRAVPESAKKTIGGGRLKGMTDINPMWRIKTLTEQFGVCGIGWKTEITRAWLESGANEEVSANVEIKLYINVGGSWSEAIPGIGGSKFVAKESSGLMTDDEAYKKAYTDALSVACKALGIGADVYFDKDTTKYDTKTVAPVDKPTPEQFAQAAELDIDLGKLAVYLKCKVDEISRTALAEAIEMKHNALRKKAAKTSLTDPLKDTIKEGEQ